MKEVLGKPVAERILAKTKERAASAGVAPGLGVVLVGSDPASRLYVGIKERRAAELGFRFVKHELPGRATEEEIIAAVRILNADTEIHGIIVQLPLPSGIDTDRVIASIDPKKDADGIHPESLRRFLSGAQGALPVFPQALIVLARSAGVPFAGKSALGIVRSGHFQKVLTTALLQTSLRADVFLKSEEEKWRPRLREADFIFTACGVPGLFELLDVRDGAVIIDGGIAKMGGKTVGDVVTEGAEAKPGFFSPVPGGVGPVTVACLLFRVSELALLASKTTR